MQDWLLTCWPAVQCATTVPRMPPPTWKICNTGSGLTATIKDKRTQSFSSRILLYNSTLCYNRLALCLLNSRKMGYAATSTNKSTTQITREPPGWSPVRGVVAHEISDEKDENVVALGTGCTSVNMAAVMHGWSHVTVTNDYPLNIYWSCMIDSVIQVIRKWSYDNGWWWCMNYLCTDFFLIKVTRCF